MGTGRSTDIANSYGAAAVTKSDSTVLPTTRALWIGVTGDVVVTMAHGETPITFKNVPVGVLPVQVTKVLAATTASEIVAMY
jgi:hypothetical protein